VQPLRDGQYGVSAFGRAARYQKLLLMYYFKEILPDRNEPGLVAANPFGNLRKINILIARDILELRRSRLCGIC
jgi:hypothetical protein